MTTPSTKRRRFPILRFLSRALTNWRLRHQDPRNFAIHMLGIPLAVAGFFLLIFWPSHWYWGVGGLFLGYLLQWIGHRWEGNDVGEWAGIKRLFGFPAVGISPRFAQTTAPDPGHIPSEVR
jgi:hypothetical protein